MARPVRKTHSPRRPPTCKKLVHPSGSSGAPHLVKDPVSSSQPRERLPSLPRRRSPERSSSEGQAWFARRSLGTPPNQTDTRLSQALRIETPCRVVPSLGTRSQVLNQAPNDRCRVCNIPTCSSAWSTPCVRELPRVRIPASPAGTGPPDLGGSPSDSAWSKPEPSARD
jgi:hypothetical protein